MSNSGDDPNQSQTAISVDLDRFRRRLDERYPGLVIPPAQDREYETAEARDRSIFTEWLTSIEDHFICHRYTIPDIDASTWTVSMTGLDDETVDLAVESIVEDYPTASVTHTMECAGNSRSGFEDTDGSVLWSCTAVSNAVWIGTPVSAVLEDTDVEIADDTWLTVVGADAPDGEAIFARSIPMQKILDDCILAYGMNGETLPEEHGYPLRLIVPGWYGVNNVKWIERMEVMETMMFGEEWEPYYTYQQQKYRIYPASVDEPTRMQTVSTFDTLEQFEAEDIDYPYAFDQTIKSAIGYPDDSATITTEGRPIEVLGAAWAGDDRVDRVDVSADGGETWEQAEFLGPALPGSWRLFRYMFDPDPGEYTLVSRAEDEHGRRQPARMSNPEDELMEVTDEEFPWNPRGYCNNSYTSQAVAVTIE